MACHNSLFLAFWISSTSCCLIPLSAIHAFRLVIQSIRFLPLLLFPSIFPVSARFSRPSFLITCPKNLSCLVLISPINFLVHSSSLYGKPLHWSICLPREFIHLHGGKQPIDVCKIACTRFFSRKGQGYTSEKYGLSKHPYSLCMPRIGGLSWGGPGNVNFTTYSLGLFSNSLIWKRRQRVMVNNQWDL